MNSTAPPVYRPGALPSPTFPVQARMNPSPPPVYRPAPPDSRGVPMQAKMKTGAPPVYRPAGPVQPHIAGGQMPVFVQSPMPLRSANASVIQGVLDPTVVTQQQAKATLSPELQAGLALAQAHPAKLDDANVPAWVAARVDKEWGEKQLPAFTTLWQQQKANVLAKQSLTKLKRKPTADELAAAEIDVRANNQADLDLYVQNKLPDAMSGWKKTQLAERTEVLQKKWAETWANNSGLPGVKGAGGYQEYYAGPDPASSTLSDHKFFGKNRILHNVSGLPATADAAYANKWYATGDHYVTFTLITDA